MHFGDIVLEQRLDPVLERGGGAGAAGAGTLHGQGNHPVLEPAIDNIAAIVGHCRADPRFDQFLDLRDHIGMGRIIAKIFVLGRNHDPASGGRMEQWQLHHEMIEQHCDHLRLERRPVRSFARRNRHKIAPKQHAGDIAKIEQRGGQRTGRRIRVIAKIAGPGIHDFLPRKELQGGRIGRGFGFDEHERDVGWRGEWGKGVGVGWTVGMLSLDILYLHDACWFKQRAKKMKIFISWSGTRSKELATALKDWLPTVLQYVQPWMSSSDINSGDRWSNEIAKQLQETNFGILCVTKENLEAPWLLFEAGALAKSMQDGRVIPLRLDVDVSDITGPLQQFHSEKADDQGVKKLLSSLNASWTNPIGDDVLQNVFEPMWTVLERKIAAIPESEVAHKKSRSTPEVLEDLVSNVRNMEMRIRDTMDDDPMMRRKFRRKNNPGMLLELGHMIGSSRGDPINLLISASIFRDDVPWLYELALEAYRNLNAGNSIKARRSFEQYRRAVEVLMNGPFAEFVGMDSKIAYMNLRDAFESVSMFDAMESDAQTSEAKPIRDRKGREPYRTDEV